VAASGVVQTLITAGQVVVGPASDRITDGAVLVDGGTITAVGPREEVTARAAPDATRLDRPHGTLLPGLINAHVHLVFEPGHRKAEDILAALREATDVDLALAMAGRARQLLDGGVTTARDLGDRGGLAVRVRDSIASGAIAGPRLLVATAPLTKPGGHCWFLGGEVDGGADELRAAVRAVAAAGADVVKVMASGGQITPGGADMWERQFDADELRIVVAEAALVGLPVAVHAHGTDSIADAVAAGVTTIEHCTWMAGQGVSDFRPEVADAMAEAGVVACPASSGNWRPLAERVGRERVTELFGRLRKLADHGVGIILGNDAGLTPFDDFGSVLRNWSDWGFTVEEVVDMATGRAADVLGLGDVTGRLRPGLAADLLLVEGDPFTDADALLRVDRVVARGRVHTPVR
jgi:imidazolonepropionase-like amidohydrolase